MGRPMIHHQAEVGEGARVGDDTKVWHQAQVMDGAVVGAGCTLGKGAFVGPGTAVGDGVKIGNHADLFGAEVGDGAFIGPHALLMEDPAPRSLDLEGRRRGPGDFERRPVRVGAGATIGGGALVLPGVMVGEHAMVGAGSVVHKDVPAHALVAGNPARQVGWACRCGLTLPEDLTCRCGLRHALVDGALSEQGGPSGG